MRIAAALPDPRTFAKFCVVGACGVVVNLGIFTLLYRYGLNKFAASPVAIECSIVSNFLMNNAWTFSGRNRADTFLTRAVKFNAVSLTALAVSYSVFVVLCLLFPAVPPQWHQAAGIVPGTFVNYFLNSGWTFRHTPGAE